MLGYKAERCYVIQNLLWETHHQLLNGQRRQSFFPAEVCIVGEGIRVASDEVAVPIAVRYGYKDCPQGEVFNTRGFLLAPFRTERW